MFGLGVEPKEIFLAYSIQFVFLTIRLVPGNVVMVTTDMRGKSPITGGVNIWNNVKTCVFQYFRSFYCRYYFCFKISVSYCLYFCLDGYFDGCVVPITAAAVVFIYLCVNLFVFLFFCFYLFIYLFIYVFIYLFIQLFIICSATSTVILIFVVIGTAPFVVGVIVAFCVRLVIVLASLMLMFSVLVLSFVPYFTVNSVDK